MPPTRDYDRDALASSLSQVDWDSILMVTKNEEGNFKTIRFEATLLVADKLDSAPSFKAWIGRHCYRVYR